MKGIFKRITAFTVIFAFLLSQMMLTYALQMRDLSSDDSYNIHSSQLSKMPDVLESTDMYTNELADDEINIIKSVNPTDNFENMGSYTLRIGDDADSIQYKISSFDFALCTETEPVFPIISNIDKWVLAKADWYLKDGEIVKTKYDNIHFSVDTLKPSSYELIGTLILPTGYTFAENLTVPTAHIFIEVEPAKKQEIVQIANLDLLLGSIVLPLGDENTWNETYNKLQNDFAWFGAVTENNEEAMVIAESIICSDVNIKKPGKYEVTIRFKLTDEYEDLFFLPESLAIVSIPVYVADPQTFGLYLYKKKSNEIVITWLYPLDDTRSISILSCSSETELGYDELSFIPYEDETLSISLPLFFSINRSSLNNGTHYYFQMEQDGVYSGVIHIIDDGENIFSDGWEGDRDGGDRDEQLPPPVTLPPLTDNKNDKDDRKDRDDKKNDVSYTYDDNSGKNNSQVFPIYPREDGFSPVEPSPNSVSSESVVTHPTSTISPAFSELAESLPSVNLPNIVNDPPTQPIKPATDTQQSVISLEEDTKDYTVFSNRRLLEICETENTLRVKKNHITVDLPWQSEIFTTLTEDSHLKIEILSLSQNTMSISILLDEIPCSVVSFTITMPYTKISTDTRLSVHSDTNESYSATYNDTLQTITFNADKTGVFTVYEQTTTQPYAEEPSAVEFNSQQNINLSQISIIIIITLCGIVCITYLYFCKRGRRD